MFSIETNPYLTVIESFLSKLRSEGKTIESHQLENDVIEEGNNFCSGIAKLKIKYKSNGNSTTLNLLLKVPSVSAFYDKLSELNMYKNETLMYSVILPEMYKIYDANLTAKMYHLCGPDNLILEDINPLGYKMLEKKEQLNFDRSLLAIQALAKFHALSVKLDEINKTIIDLIVIPPRSDTKSEAIHTLFDKFNNTVELLTISPASKLKVQNFQFEFLPQAFNETMIPSQGLNVLCHGDYWMGNMLFKDQSDTPAEIKIVDFQMVHRCSPVIDLIEFFVTSVQFAVYEENRIALIQNYLDTFNQVLESLESGTRYTWEQLKNDMERYKLFYIYNLGAYLPAVLNDKEDPFNFSGKDSQVYEAELYKIALTKWIRHLEEENFI